MVDNKVVIPRTDVCNPMITDELNSVFTESIGNKFHEFYNMFTSQAGKLSSQKLTKINASIDTGLGILYEGENILIKNVENQESVKKMQKNSCGFIPPKNKESYHNNPGISLHRFPKDPSVRTQWLNACGFTENDILCRQQICSMHFEQSCYTTGHKKVLNRGSIPTKCIEKSLMSVCSIQTMNDLSIQTESCENQSVIVIPEKYCSLNMDLYQNQIMCMPSTSASIQTTIQTEPLIYGINA
ncbi:hypothetical protein AGLY_016724 [Aphis glycines]|uniref:THAP-type domain-containing protein n=1 Tax=Aphis glycines TaxID=307491 RepID=A0A6G0SX15_APHGL|nr:hypothetical protein AGLY_016724 [Aphis glycines]